MNKVEVLKAEKDGLDILNDIPAFTAKVGSPSPRTTGTA